MRYLEVSDYESTVPSMRRNYLSAVLVLSERVSNCESAVPFLESFNEVVYGSQEEINW